MDEHREVDLVVVPGGPLTDRVEEPIGPIAQAGRARSATIACMASGMIAAGFFILVVIVISLSYRSRLVPERHAVEKNMIDR